MASERPDHTLSPTALTHEVYMRLEGTEGASRGQLLALAARAARRVLVDHARRRSALKRPGARRLGLDPELLDFGGDGALDGPDVDALGLDAALEQLESIAPRQARVVELRFFGGLTFQEVADSIGVSLITAKRDWEFARTWLFNALKES